MIGLCYSKLSTTYILQHDTFFWECMNILLRPGDRKLTMAIN